jgi:hypothetical protein
MQKSPILGRKKYPNTTKEAASNSTFMPSYFLVEEFI